MSVEISPVWKQVSPELEAELVHFWVKHNAITDEALAGKRAQQVACLARSPQGEIVGVSTAEPRVVPRLRQPMYYYRNFIAADFRGQQLARTFLEKTKREIGDPEILGNAAINLALPKPRCLGIVIELENEALAAHHDLAQWRSGFTFIGYSPRGFQMRVWYFEGVRLLPPARLRRPAKVAS